MSNDTSREIIKSLRSRLAIAEDLLKDLQFYFMGADIPDTVKIIDKVLKKIQEKK